ncbi:1959_t:CDS:2 [Diversispora eburnea]|uniref:1959_t:CDS:1 n=1 Tax=Diversispora eburnea TaxID=1213867 RepID=A0A9N8ZB46_9GLOM|nr:1959_t:CDS:2 [Diversispora eburnea]
MTAQSTYGNRTKNMNYNYSLPIIQKIPQLQPLPSPQRHKEKNLISQSDLLLFDNIFLNHHHHRNNL